MDNDKITNRHITSMDASIWNTKKFKKQCQNGHAFKRSINNNYSKSIK